MSNLGHNKLQAMAKELAKTVRPIQPIFHARQNDSRSCPWSRNGRISWLS